MSMDYGQAEEYLKSLPVFSPAAVTAGEQTINLDSIRILLKRLGSPEQKLAYIHVAGTNGKGSVCAFLNKILTECGIRTGCFTSPALRSFTECIRVNGAEIEKAAAGRLLSIVKEEAEGMRMDGYRFPSEFEQMLALAFLYFTEQNCALVILETGLGGTSDATNVIPAPELAVITAISFDHMQLLGSTLAAIAAQKAGIIKENTTVLSALQEPEVINVIADACEKTSSVLTIARPPVRTGGNLNGQTFYLKELGSFQIPFAADYQVDNAVLAIEAALQLQKKGYPVDMQSIRQGLLHTRWQGRFEIKRTEPPLIVDGGHNVQGMEALARNLRRLFGGRKIYFVTGVFADKQYREMMAELLPLAAKFFTVAPPSGRALDSKQLAEYLRTQGAAAEPVRSVPLAVSMAEKEAGNAVCVCGSLSFLAEINDYIKE